ncbi:MAG: ferrochelatase [Actinomycetota bacterium]|nr:ferrochelatase [Actinomycetota bacterium]
MPRSESGRIGVLVMAYGTPRHPDEIEAYYTDIRRGNPPSPEQLADLTDRYEAIGGTSPLAQRTEDQRIAVEVALDELAPGRYHVVTGLKHADPKIEEAVDELADGGCTKIVGLVLAPHFSSMSVGQYLRRASAAAERHGIDVVGIESWATEAPYVEFLVEQVTSALAVLPAATVVLFTAHSLPRRVVDEGDPYPSELGSTAQAVADGARLASPEIWMTAWQSAGRTPEPWLGPDVLEVIDDLAGAGTAEGVLVCACGFVSDHLEVLYDLDIEARRWAEQRGLSFARTECVNDHPAVMTALAMRIHAAAG